MSREIYEEVRKWVKDPQHGSRDYGKLGALPQYIRNKIHELCNFAESADKMVMSFLTPPTEQEVCKALSGYFEQDVKYISGMFYYGEDLQFTEICDTTIEDLNGNQLYNIYLHLPPHLITMIGKLYESRVKE